LPTPRGGCAVVPGLGLGYADLGNHGLFWKGADLDLGLDPYTLTTGLVVFLLRIVDVSLGTIRTISTVQGRTRTAFLLGFVEVSMWLAVIAAIVSRVAERPILGVFYALGFSTGNVAGILIERKLAFGHTVLRVFARQKGEKLASTLRSAGHAVTSFEGKGRPGGEGIGDSSICLVSPRFALSDPQ